MDVKKQPLKSAEAIDATQAMNNLLNKVAQAITSESPATVKNLTEIRDILIGLQNVNKATDFILYPDTIGNIRKALSEVQLPDEKQLKEAGIVPPSPDRVTKSLAINLPETDDEAPQKINQVVNANLEVTIKSLNEVIEATEAANKEGASLPADAEKTDKLLVEVVTTLFGTGLKQFAELNFPENPTAKGNQEILLNKDRQSKIAEQVGQPALTSDKSQNVLREALRTSKNESPLDNYEPIKETKSPLGIGDIPNPFRKEEQLTGNYEANKTQKNPEGVLVYETSPTEKTVNDLDQGDMAIDSAKSEQDLADVEVDGKINYARAGREAIIPGSAGNKIENSLTAVEVEGTKPSSPDEWYRNWGWPSGDNKLQSQKTKLFGGRVDLSSAFMTGVGQTLAFFGVTSSDIALFANKAKREFNSKVNAFALASGIQQASIGKGTKEILTQEDMRGYDPKRFAGGYNSQDSQFVERKGYINDANQEVGNVVSSFDLNNPMLRERISDRGKLGPGNSSRVKEGYNASDTTFSMPALQEVQSRTADILNGKKGTGFLKIYLKRGPKFSDSLTESKVIPFQFEPVVSGDAKGAEYSQISTLAKSQSAQVYRKSSERAITLALDYIVVKTKDESKYRDVKTSKSVEDMSYWTEDYIYGYVVRNLRNLVLPNITTATYKLAPPIVQVWYGGISQSGSSTGEGLPDEKNEKMDNIYPTFRTNWYSYDGSTQKYNYRTYRSLWVCTNVSFEYKGGIVNKESRNYVWVTATLSLTEIAPSVTDNELLIWRDLTG